MEKPLYPKGCYECPKCGSGLEVFVPLVEPPTHHCGVGKKVYAMVYKGETNDKARNRIRGLGESEEDTR